MQTKLPAKLFKEVLRADYRKRDVYLEVAESVRLHDLNWSGGTRYTYEFVRLTDSATFAPNLGAPPPWENHNEGAIVPLSDGLICICYKIFCGKKLPATIFVHPSNAPRLLGAVQ